MSTGYRLVGAWRVESNTGFTLTKVGAVASPPGFSGELATGLWYPCGNADVGNPHRDVIQLVNEALVTAIADAGLGVTCVLSVDQDTGELSAAVGGVSSITLELDGAVAGGDAAGTSATDLFEKLGLYAPGGSTEVEIGNGVLRPLPDNPLPHFTFYPRYYLLQDLERTEVEASQFVPSSGNPQTILVSERERHILEVRTEGFPRQAGYNEYHHLKAFMSAANTGMPFRFYPERDVVDAYEPSQREGYIHLTLEKKSMGWSPKPDKAGWYKRMRQGLGCLQYHPV